MHLEAEPIVGSGVDEHESDDFIGKSPLVGRG